MAKKKQNLSPEELLEQALVPESERPYGVPENWVWVRLPHICKYIRAGGDKPKNATDIKDEINKIPIVANGIVNDGIIGFTDMPKAEKDTITISARGTIGFSVMRDYEYYPIVRLIVIKPHDFVYPKLVKYMFDYFLEEGTGSSIPQLTVPMLSDKYVPLPPIAEQQRIVDRIESLFEKLDQAKGLIQDALDSFENRKAAILHKSFSGELTKKWREENGVGMESWEEKCLKDVLDVRDGTHDSPQYHESGYALVTSKNLKNGCLVFSDIKYINKDDYEKINLRSRVNVGDILFAMIGTIGNPVVVTDDPNYAIKNVALLKTIQKIDSFYVKYYLESKFVKDKMTHEAKGSTQKFVSLGYLRDFPISVPTTIEQIEIVRILSTLLSNEERSREYLEVVNNIDLMKKSILARAFHGELGTNNPSEESSKYLIEKIFAEDGGELI